MSAETELYSALSGATAVTSLVAQRIYPDAVPQEQRGPSIAYARQGTEPVTTIHSAAPLGAFALLEVACMAAKRADADAVADAAIAALGAAQFVLQDRRAEFDSDLQLWGTVLTVRKWSTT